MFDDSNPLIRGAYLFMASVAGAITALSVRPFKGMTPGQIVFSVFVGATSAIYLGPFVVRALLGQDADMQLQAGIFYIIATGNNAFIPAAVRWTLRMSPFGKGEAE